MEYTRDRAVEVRFIEFMPFSGNKWDDSKLVPYKQALRAVFKQYPDLTPAPPRDNDTATVCIFIFYVINANHIALRLT